MRTLTKKTCSRCGYSKPVSAFALATKRTDGRQCWCRPCMTAAARQYELNHRAERHEQRRLKKMDPWQRARFLLRSATERATAIGMEINLTREWIASKLDAGVCEATGLPLDLAGEAQTDSRCRWPWAPSLDRIDNSKGYVVGNVRVVVWMYNLAKNRWTDADVLRLADALVARQQNVSRQPV